MGRSPFGSSSAQLSIRPTSSHPPQGHGHACGDSLSVTQPQSPAREKAKEVVVEEVGLSVCATPSISLHPPEDQAVSGAGHGGQNTSLTFAFLSSWLPMSSQRELHGTLHNSPTVSRCFLRVAGAEVFLGSPLERTEAHH